MRNFPVLEVPQRWPISDVGDYLLLINRFSVISIRHTSSILPTATGFLVSVPGVCFFAVTSTKSSRPSPTHQSPASCPRMYVPPACLYCPLQAPPHPPRAAAHAPAAEYHVVRHLASAVPNLAANPAFFMQAARPWRNSPIRFRYAPLLLAPAHPSRLATNMRPPPGCS